MKQIIFFILLSFSISVNAQTKEEKLKQTIDLYFNGGPDNMRKAFHPNAELRFFRDGKFQQIDIETFIGRSKVWDKTDGTVKKLVSFDITETAAQAKLSIEGKTFSITDYMNLLYVDNEWKIVGKIFHSQPK
jgi:hypothetical protein